MFFSVIILFLCKYVCSITSAKDPFDLETKIQKDGNDTIDWFEKNDMVTSSDKTKLLIIGTKKNRITKLESQNIKLKIDINHEKKTETSSEKLLGVIVSTLRSIPASPVHLLQHGATAISDGIFGMLHRLGSVEHHLAGLNRIDTNHFLSGSSQVSSEWVG